MDDVYTTIRSCIENLDTEFRPALIVLILTLCQYDRYNSEILVFICKACSNKSIDIPSMHRCLNIIVQYLEAGYSTEPQNIAAALAAGASKIGYVSTMVKILDLVEIN